jgi:hypothetical protein
MMIKRKIMQLKLNLNMTVFYVVAPCSLVEAYRLYTGTCCFHHQGGMDAAISSETSVNLYQFTQRYNPQGSHLHNRRRENPKYYEIKF